MLDTNIQPVCFEGDNIVSQATYVACGVSIAMSILQSCEVLSSGRHAAGHDCATRQVKVQVPIVRGHAIDALQSVS